MFAANILFVGRDEAVQRAAFEASDRAGCRFQSAENLDAALLEIHAGAVSLVLFHLKSQDEEPQLARLLHEADCGQQPIPVVVLAEEIGWAARLRLLQLGVVDCLLHPLDHSRLAFLVDFLTIRARYEGLRVAADSVPNGPVPKTDIAGFVFSSPKMRAMLEQIRAVAPLDTNVLVTGETGTGKTRLAEVIHQLSPRKEKPLVVVHCAALPATLLESELFGHVKGAFTSADQDRTGKFDEAADGTLLLDEVDCLPLECQAKLLRAVENRVFEAVGSPRTRQMRARLIAASNRPLEDLVAAGEFRSDLYYRLNVVNFSLPPLRDRRKLIRPLVARFLGDFSSQAGRHVTAVSAAALAALERFDWPGNVRELRNVLERAVALCTRPTIEVGDLPEAIRRFNGVAADGADGRSRTDLACSSGGSGLERARKEAELRRLVDALDRHNNNRSRAAVELGISRVTLYKKLRRYGIA